MPDDIINDLYKFSHLALDLACDGDMYGLSDEQMDMFNDISDDLADFLAEVGLAELRDLLDKAAASA